MAFSPVYSVILTGSREHPRLEQVDETLDALLEEYGRIRVAHGHAQKGVDKRADDWLVAKLGGRKYATGSIDTSVQVKRYPADWERFPKTGGVIRNSYMVRDEAFRVRQGLAFLHDASDGTLDCIRKMCDRNIPVTIFHSNGQVEELRGSEAMW